MSSVTKLSNRFSLLGDIPTENLNEYTPEPQPQQSNYCSWTPAKRDIEPTKQSACEQPTCEQPVVVQPACTRERPECDHPAQEKPVRDQPAKDNPAIVQPACAAHENPASQRPQGNRIPLVPGEASYAEVTRSRRIQT